MVSSRQDDYVVHWSNTPQLGFTKKISHKFPTITSPGDQWSIKSSTNGHLGEIKYWAITGEIYKAV